MEKDSDPGPARSQRSTKLSQTSPECEDEMRQVSRLRHFEVVRVESAGPQVRNAGAADGVALGVHKVGE